MLTSFNEAQKVKPRSVILRNLTVGASGLLWIALFLRVASTPTANLSFLILAMYAACGLSQAIRALAMCWLFTMISPGIAPDASLGSIGRYIVFLAAFVSVFCRSRRRSDQFKVKKAVFFTMALGVFFVIHSLLFSSQPDVSILKAISWTIVTATLFSAWSGLDEGVRNRVFHQLYLGLVAVMAASLPLFILPLGYLRNGSGFQGILDHPQAFGPTMAILGTIAAGKLFAEKKPAWHYIVVFGVSLSFIIASEARTAGLAMILGLTIAVATILLLSGKRIHAVLPGLSSRRLWGATGAALILAIIFAPQIVGKFENYISKSGRAGSVESIAAAYDKSRGGLIDRMFTNIYEKPLTGIGFGIASEPEHMVVERDPLFGLPVSAVVEKGVMPLVVVEELGIPGAFLVLLWLIFILRKAANFSVIGVALVATAILINMGESIFFSPGGLGMLILIGVCWAGSGQRPADVRH